MSKADELNELIRQGEDILAKAGKAYSEALLSLARLQVQRDLAFLSTGDKSIFDSITPGVRH